MTTKRSNQRRSVAMLAAVAVTIGVGASAASLGGLESNQLTLFDAVGTPYEVDGISLLVTNVRDRDPGPSTDLAEIVRIRMRFPMENVDGIALTIGGGPAAVYRFALCQGALKTSFGSVEDKWNSLSDRTSGKERSACVPRSGTVR
jgi:hypothetical protein